MRFRNTLPPLALASAVALAGCAPADPAAQPTPTSTVGDGHGAIAGAEEVTEPQLQLMTVSDEGAVEALDLLTEETAELGSIDGVTATTTDGRYLFASAAASGTVSVIDSGAWTWDHEDHFHYYRATPREVGVVEGAGEATIATSASNVGVFFPESGEAVLLDGKALADGDIREVFRLETEPHEGTIVPFGDGALVTRPDAAGVTAEVQAYDAAGEPTGDVEACTGAASAITTVVGVAFPCAEGALLVTDGDGGIRFESVPYPADATAPAATTFSARENRPTVAGLAGERGVWLLDTRQRSWSLVTAEAPLQQVTAVDDNDGHVLGLTTDGRVTVLSETGATLATTEPLVAASLADPALAAGVTLVADQQRAYLNGPAEQRLFELDFADAGRVARTFDTDHMPAFVAETGR
ncbi:ABC transporter [Desertivibrio insolitus]|uniref:ABC transporter n=1 Tax=Herbiconiux sp. SYSU D00978 TaxID=2812562 RepID=UPI001A9715C2|nr:ABC transporter [Herbiconiux sp. SYSU D00978]